jgi:hypothetical protein
MMQRYRKKPVVIEAMRFHAYTEAMVIPGRPITEFHQWLIDGGASFELRQEDPGPAYLVIKTLEGPMRADVGWWIIKGVQGEFYPCKPDIFAATYEAVSDGS